MITIIYYSSLKSFLIGFFIFWATFLRLIYLFTYLQSKY